MTVYLDNSNIIWRGKRWCHMYADSLQELNEFAKKVGLKLEWLQNGTGTSGLPHYDITGTMLEKAISLGVTRVDSGDGSYRRLRQMLTRGEYPL